MKLFERWTRGFRRAAWPRDRRGWGTAALTIVLLAHAFRYATWMGRDAHTYSDGYYSWIFARSLAFDYDIDLSNDYALCGDPFRLGVDEGGGRPANPFYFGPALLLGPLLWIVKHVAVLAPTASASWRNGCTGPFVLYTGATSALACGIIICVGYRIARRWYDEVPCAIAALVMGLASPLNVLGTLSWYYSHVWAALAVAFALLATIRASETPLVTRRWFVAGIACGFAALMRMQEALWFIVPLAAIGHSFWSGERGASGFRAALRRVLVSAAGFIVVFVIQLYVFNRLYGSPFVIPQGKLYVQLAHAHPWLLLFGARSGFLYWTPLMWLSILGAPWFIHRGPSRAVAMAVVFVCCASFFVASAALSWTGSATLGARVQTSLVPALLPLAAAFLHAGARWVTRHRAAAGAVLALALAPWILNGWNAAVSGMPNDRPVSAPDLYGAGARYSLKQAYDAVGNPWTLPAGAVFYARYGAHPRVLDALASEGLFQKHYRTLAPMGSDTLLFAQPPTTYWSEGIDSSGSAPLLPANVRGRILVTLYWPWVTSIRLTARPVAGPVNLTIRSGSFFRRREVGRATFTTQQTVELGTAPGLFDSGINELLLVSDGPLELVSLQWVDLGEHDTSIRVFGRK